MDSTGMEERVARLEERMTSMVALLGEIREQQREIADTIAHAHGGLKVLLLLGAVAGAVGTLRGVSGWVEKLH